MVTGVPRFMLAIASLLQLLEAAAHTAAFHRARVVIDNANLPAFIGKSSKAVWLADSTTMCSLAVIFAFVAARPTAATRPLVLLLALIPAATAVLIYTFLGNFFAGHLLLATAAAVFVAGLQFPGARE
jgi:hypothetical protein